MNQTEARRVAREIADSTNLTPVVDTIRTTSSGLLLRGGWPSEDQTWAVFLWGTNKILAPVEHRMKNAMMPSLSEQLDVMDAGLDKTEVFL